MLLIEEKKIKDKRGKVYEKKLLGLMLCTAILGSMMIGCGSKPAQDSSAAPEKATEESADGQCRQLK